MNKISKEFKDKIKKTGRKYSWFLREYLPDFNYSTFLSQVNGYSPMSEKLDKAIKKFLEK